MVEYVSWRWKCNNYLKLTGLKKHFSLWPLVFAALEYREMKFPLFQIDEWSVRINKPRERLRKGYENRDIEFMDIFGSVLVRFASHPRRTTKKGTWSRFSSCVVVCGTVTQAGNSFSAAHQQFWEKRRLQENDIFSGESFHCFSHSCDFQLKKIIKSFFFSSSVSSIYSITDDLFSFWENIEKSQVKVGRRPNWLSFTKLQIEHEDDDETKLPDIWPPKLVLAFVLVLGSRALCYERHQYLLGVGYFSIIATALSDDIPFICMSCLAKTSLTVIT